MEMYFGNDYGGDSVVPREQEPIDRLPSPNSWSQWGVSESQNPMFPAKGFGYTNSTKQEPYFDEGSHYEDYLVENNSSSSSLYQGFSKGSYEQATNTQMDDIFLDSFLEEDSTSKDNHFGQYDLISEQQHGLLAENNLDDMIEELDNESRYYGAESSDTSGRFTFQPSIGQREEEADCHHMPQRSRQKYDLPNKVLLATASSKHDRSGDLEVLQEFERVVTQLSGKSRLCYRDSMYRLAKNSMKHVVQHSSECEENPPTWPIHEESSSYRRQEDVDVGEAETNAIDRTVANLMFCKIDDSGTQEGAVEAGGYHNYNSSLSCDNEEVSMSAQRRQQET